MRLFRLFTGDDQQSHLEELKMAFTSGQIAEQTSMQPAAGVIFTRMAPGTFVDWHNAPRRQYVITASLGDYCRTNPGNRSSGETLPDAPDELA
jgi:hypothetical protein